MSERMCGFKSHLAHFKHLISHLTAQRPARSTAARPTGLLRSEQVTDVAFRGESAQHLERVIAEGFAHQTVTGMLAAGSYTTILPASASSIAFCPKWRPHSNFPKTKCWFALASKPF